MGFKTTLSSTWNLACVNPELSNEWHPVLNKPLKPCQVTPNSHRKVWWRCVQQSHEWQVSIKDRNQKKTGYPYCAGNLPTADYNLAVVSPDLAAEWHMEKNMLQAKDVTPYSNRIFYWKCPKGHEWKSNVLNRQSGNGCPSCSGRVATEENNLARKRPDLVAEWHPSKNGNLTPDQVTPSSGKRVWWCCPSGHEWISKINSRYWYPSCPKCSKRVSKAGTRWLDGLNVRSREVYLKTGIFADGFDPVTNTVYEFLGDYWHGNPEVFPPDTINPSVKKTYGQLFLKTVEKLDKLVQSGYKVVYRWESGKQDIGHSLENSRMMRSMVKC